jgi:hypothetical protein
VAQIKKSQYTVKEVTLNFNFIILFSDIVVLAGLEPQGNHLKMFLKN